MNIYLKAYWKNEPHTENKLRLVQADTNNHEEAILLTCSWAEEEKVNLTSPVLAVINGNKKEVNEKAA